MQSKLQISFWPIKIFKTEKSINFTITNPFSSSCRISSNMQMELGRPMYNKICVLTWWDWNSLHLLQVRWSKSTPKSDSSSSDRVNSACRRSHRILIRISNHRHPNMYQVTTLCITSNSDDSSGILARIYISYKSNIKFMNFWLWWWTIRTRSMVIFIFVFLQDLCSKRVDELWSKSNLILMNVKCCWFFEMLNVYLLS